MADMGSITLADKLSDVREKLGAAYEVVKGMALPSGAFRLKTEVIRGAPVRVFKNCPPAVGTLFRELFPQWGDKEWIFYGDETYTFNSGLQIAEAVAAALRESFMLKRGDAVGIAMRNLPEYMLAFTAIMLAGCVAVPLNSLWKEQEMEYAIKDSGCKVVFGDAERLKLCQSFRDEIGLRMVLCKGDEAVRAEIGANLLWEDVVASGREQQKVNLSDVGDDQVMADDDAMIMYTSGSTGFPKGVVQDQRSVGTCIKIGQLASRVTPMSAPVSMLAVPLFHITGLSTIYLWSIPSGSQIVIMRKWNAGEALELIHKHKVTTFTGVPTMVRDMMEHPNFTAEAIASVKNMAAGGAPVPPSQVAQLRKKTKSTSSVQGYGLTETMGGVTVNKGLDYIKNPTSCGKPIPLLVEVQVKDPETGLKVPDGQRGEVCIRCAMTLKRYHNRPEDTAKVLDKEGFFHSGDIGKMENGFVFILDRMKDIIIRGGENIDCSEVEICFYEHPAVRECCVFGLPDERLGEVVAAALWVNSDGQSDMRAALVEHASKTLAKFKVPEIQHIYLHSEELPKGATGKIAKKDLREHYAEAMKAQPPRSRL